MNVLGVIGGGQLARMMIGPAVELGVELRVLAEGADSAARDRATMIGDYRDIDTVLNFAEGVDVITFDHEHVPAEVLDALTAKGVSVHPGPAALAVAQDKLLMRKTLQKLGLPMPEWAEVADEQAVMDFLAKHGGRAVAKTPRGGYDGKGVEVITDASEVKEWLARGPVLLEELVDFSRELAVLVARSPSGALASWPVCETVQVDGMCSEVILPAPKASERLKEAADEIGRHIAEGLGVTGVLAVELFETTDERLLVNELAMRPHNSGHATIEGSVTSQFEQHIRAVLDLPLGSTALRAPWSVMCNVIGSMDRAGLAKIGEQSVVKIHHYGKADRPGRKVGHVTAIGNDLPETVYQARAVSEIFKTDI